MFSGTHIIIYSTDPQADRACLRDTLGLSFVDAGDGWLIFALPAAAEVAIHPHATSGAQEVYLICEDITATCDALEAAGLPSEPPSDEGWGILSGFTLPGGSRLRFYQPRHARPTG
ncbi:VOC family protein [Pararhodobacter oceanensis]|uniref:Extradiol dioxygenase n=1 Tax=Pararhodobacter oceanensis TaxID=2172121 RepID=A0A2T8HQT0_9RHOB|nr:VOC family protein [Pararhodobacter oceanensis]PVH27765.1 extradiol dioxygenase [Pararhodobacter oceanensis]